MGDCPRGEHHAAFAVAEAGVSKGDGVLAAAVRVVFRRKVSVYEVEVTGTQAEGSGGSRGGVTYDEDGDVVMSDW